MRKLLILVFFIFSSAVFAGDKKMGDFLKINLT
jgi:hypothetical protein